MGESLTRERKQDSRRVGCGGQLGDPWCFLVGGVALTRTRVSRRRSRLLSVTLSGGSEGEP